MLWLGVRIWVVEFADEPIAYGNNKVYGHKARLVEELTRWNKRTARLFAADCAERVLHLYEAEFPDDTRPRDAIAAARAYANGTLSKAALKEARKNAWKAVEMALGACDAAEVAAYAAAWSAAPRRAWEAAQIAARSSAEALGWTVIQTRWGWTAAQAHRKAWAAGYAVEQAWQTERLFDYLEGRA